MELVSKLAEIQQTLNAPKGQFNSFGKYAYRSCEDILTAVKPLLGELVLVVTDEIVMLGDRFYVKATARIEGKEKGYIEANGWAREALNKKGMDESQITGSASSYARKYALNGLFCIDDNKDADSMDNRNSNKIEAPTANDKAWIDAIKNGSSKLEDINGPQYRNKIKGFLK